MHLYGENKGEGRGEGEGNGNSMVLVGCTLFDEGNDTVVEEKRIGTYI